MDVRRSLNSSRAQNHDEAPPLAESGTGALQCATVSIMGTLWYGGRPYSLDEPAKARVMAATRAVGDGSTQWVDLYQGDDKVHLAIGPGTPLAIVKRALGEEPA